MPAIANDRESAKAKAKNISAGKNAKDDTSERIEVSPLWNQLAMRVSFPMSTSGDSLHMTEPQIQHAYSENLGPGRPLDEPRRSFFNSTLGRDFSDVRVHTDERARRSAHALNALAYTLGRDIVFAPNQYAPGTAAGRRLLAHELVHTVQQAAVPAGALPIMRKPLPGESDAAYKERQEVLEEAKATIKHLEQCVTKGTPCIPEETITSAGDFEIRIYGDVLKETKAQHDARLTALVADLKDIQSQFESARIPAEVLAGMNVPGLIFDVSPIQNIYVHQALKQSRPTHTAFVNGSLYIVHVIEQKPQPKPTPVKPKKQPPQSSGKTVPLEKPGKPEEIEQPTHFEEHTGYHLVVPDPKNAPLVYPRLTRFGDNGGNILDVYRDETGYFYYGYQNKKVYMPNWQPSLEGL